ncbi:DUF2767 domain-containing protein [Xenorhabdus griffiniae]|uniref:DUF2767 domain-containing protein n=1 Tax=Xenorhabdus griffiniae TaxID=351672 RepID=UPI002358EB15|nr:DUF2767 domain-containing protein [Xenorhabdus griffiniae]MDC9607242.1 DUF2767 domain-containing protein [Xenorhabdus griffiniae]
MNDKEVVYSDVCCAIGRAVVLLKDQVVTERSIWLMLKSLSDQLDSDDQYVKQIYSTAIKWMEERM